MKIAYDHELSTELESKYFVYNTENVVIYRGTYAQCLCVCGAFSPDPNTTLNEIRSKSNGYI